MSHISRGVQNKQKIKRTKQNTFVQSNLLFRKQSHISVARQSLPRPSRSFSFKLPSFPPSQGVAITWPRLAGDRPQQRWGQLPSRCHLPTAGESPRTAAPVRATSRAWWWRNCREVGRGTWEFFCEFRKCLWTKTNMVRDLTTLWTIENHVNPKNSSFETPVWLAPLFTQIYTHLNTQSCYSLWVQLIESSVYAHSDAKSLQLAVLPNLVHHGGEAGATELGGATCHHGTHLLY